MDNITKFEHKVKNSQAMKKASLTISINEAIALLTEITDLKNKVESMTNDQDQTLYIELDGGTF